MNKPPKRERCPGSVYCLPIHENALSEMRVDLGNSCPGATDRDLYGLPQGVDFPLNADSD